MAKLDLKPVTKLDLKPVRKLDLRPVEQNNIKDQNFQFQEALRQFGIGFGDEALAGFGLGTLKLAKGEEAVKSLESNNPVERFSRGLGRTVGLFTPWPSKLIKVGQVAGKVGLGALKATKGGKAIKAALELKYGADNAAKIGRFAEAMASTGGAAAAYEAFRFPDENLQEKVVSIPRAALFGAGLGAAGAYLSPSVNRFLKKKELIGKGLKADSPELKKLLKIENQIQETADENLKLKLMKKARRIEAEVIDKNAPIGHLVEDMIDITGKRPSIFDDPRLNLSKFLGVHGIIGQYKDKLRRIIQPTLIGKLKGQRDLTAHKDELFQIMKLERFVERSNNNMLNPGGFTLAESQKALNDIEKQIGSELFSELTKSAQRIRNEVLTPILESGVEVFGEKGIQRMLNKGQYFTPFDVLEKLEKDLDKIPIGANAFGRSLPGTFKGTKGTIKEIADIEDSLSRYIEKTVRFIEGQRVRRSVTNLRSLGSETKDFIKLLGKGDEVPKGFEKISVIENGIKSEYALPEEVANAINGMNKQTFDKITQMAGFFNRALRLGATSLNVAFSVPNTVRDYLNAKFTSRGRITNTPVGFSVADMVRGFAESIKKGPDYKLWAMQGGDLSGQQRIISSRGQEKLIPTISERVLEATNPINWLKSISTVSENSTRLGVFKRSLRKGLQVPEAIDNARNASIDFNRMGETMAVANVWIPFLAARTKGVANIFSAAKANPKRFALTASSMIAFPTLATFAYNNKYYPKEWREISRFEKDNNFIMIYGTERDEKGRLTQVAKIPKGDVGKLIGNPIENFLEHGQGNNPLSFKELFTQTLSDLSPVEFAREGEVSPQAIASSVTPPVIKGGIESAFNVNFFTGRSIVPRRLEKASPRQQYDEETSNFARAVGDKFNISPLKIDNFIGTTLGGAGRQLLNPKSVFPSVTKRFKGVYANQQQSEDFDLLEEIQQESADKKVIMDRTVQKALIDFKNISPIPEARRKFIQDTFAGDKKALNKFMDYVVAEQRGEQPIHRALRRMSVNDRFKYILLKVQTMDTEDERANFLAEMFINKIINKDSFKRAE